MKRESKDDVRIDQERLKQLSKSTENEKLKHSVDQKLKYHNKPISKQ